MKVVAVDSNMLTPYGRGIDAAWRALSKGRSAISALDRFPVEDMRSSYAGLVPGLSYHCGDSLVMQMLTEILAGKDFPENALLVLASTTGEIDLLERDVLARGGDSGEGRIDRLLSKVGDLAGLKRDGRLISAACTSSTTAVSYASALIRAGKESAVLVVACDAVTEFLYSGFSALRALDSGVARPFDRDRNGLNGGEAAGYVLLTSDSEALSSGQAALGEVAGWGMSNDANHMTGPSRDGAGLANAINWALSSAGVCPDDIGSICAHGTGTVYNDAMEMKAFRSVFAERAVPTYSIKGGMGHTMGAAGLVEMLLVFESLKSGLVPPSINLHEAADDAYGWVSAQIRPPDAECRRHALTCNSGFGGTNAALILRPADGERDTE